jgi:hypothetical protein
LGLKTCTSSTTMGLRFSKGSNISRIVLQFQGRIIIDSKFLISSFTHPCDWIYIHQDKQIHYVTKVFLKTQPPKTYFNLKLFGTCNFGSMVKT